MAPVEVEAHGPHGVVGQPSFPYLAARDVEAGSDTPGACDGWAFLDEHLGPGDDGGPGFVEQPGPRFEARGEPEVDGRGDDLADTGLTAGAVAGLLGADVL